MSHRAICNDCLHGWHESEPHEVKPGTEPFTRDEPHVDLCPKHAAVDALKTENESLKARVAEFDAVLVELDGLSDNELFPGFVRQACAAFAECARLEAFMSLLRAVPSHRNIVAMLEAFDKRRTLEVANHNEEES